MASLDEKFDLTDEEREVIASDIKDLDEDGYTDYSKKMSVLLSSKEKSEEVEASQPADIALAPPGREWMYALEKMSDEDKIDIAKALMKKYASQLGLATKTEAVEENVQEVVDEAIKQADVEKESVPVTSEASEPSVYNKYKEAFTVEGFDIKL
jgi:ribosome-binding ATPase YchF (GTP1/OBG family)